MNRDILKIWIEECVNSFLNENFPNLDNIFLLPQWSIEKKNKYNEFTKNSDEIHHIVITGHDYSIFAIRTYIIPQ